MSNMWNNNSNVAQRPAAPGASRRFGSELRVADTNASRNAGKNNGGVKATTRPFTQHQAPAAAPAPAVNLAPVRTAPRAPLGPVDDIDSVDRGNPQCAAEYAMQIHQAFREMEARSMVPSNYMSAQKSINHKMRTILIDWVHEVHLKFKLLPETAYLTVNLIDRYLASRPCQRRKLQLVGVTCMLIASKYEEIYFPEVRDFVYITDRAYDRAEILAMEGTVLNALKFDLTVATPLVFLKRYLKAAKASDTVRDLAHYFTERMLQEYTMLDHKPSEIAASAVSMALRASHRQPWSATLHHYSGYTEEELAPCMSKMSQIIIGNPHQNHQAVAKKYNSTKYGKVSQMNFSHTLSALVRKF